MSDFLDIMERVRAEMKTSAPKPAFMAAALRDAAMRYVSPLDLSVGDLITPISSGTTKNPGEPNLVIAIRPLAKFEFGVGDPGSSSLGLRYDVRVLHWDNGQFVAHWDESANYGRWEDPDAKTVPVTPEQALAFAKENGAL